MKRLGAELAAVALFTAALIAIGSVGASKIKHFQSEAHAAKSELASRRVVATGDASVLKLVFPHAQATSDQIVYLADDGNNVTKADFDAAPAAYRKFVLNYLEEHGGSLVHSQCFAVYSKNADGEDGWSAGYCTNTVLHRYGGGPKS